MSVPAEILDRNPILGALPEAMKSRFASAAEPRLHPPGALLIRQGDRPDGAYVILSGTVAVTNLVPGGGETPIASIGPGETVGEFGLLSSGRRISSVRAVGEVRTLFLARRFVRGACEQLDPMAFALIRAIVARIAPRLRLSLARETAELGSGDRPGGWDDRPHPGRPEPRDPPPLDPALFLPLLPGYRGWDRTGTARLIAAATVEEAPRGVTLFDAGAPCDRIFLVLRGALEALAIADGRCRRLSLFGPGGIVPIHGAIDGLAHDFTCRARERALLLAFDAGAMRDLLAAEDRLSMSLWLTMAEGLVNDFQASNDTLARLAGLWRNQAPGAAMPAA